jgi:hypothetical protein
VETAFAVDAQPYGAYGGGFGQLHFVAEVLTNRGNPKAFEILQAEKLPEHAVSSDKKLL